MKQIILGSFGVILLIGTLIAGMNIFSVTVHKSWLCHSVRAEQHILEVLAEEAADDEVFCKLVESEFKKWVQGRKVQVEVTDCDRKKGEITMQIEEEIPYIMIGKKKIIKQEYCMRWSVNGST